MAVCDACGDNAIECQACGGALNGPPALSCAWARGANRAKTRAKQYGLDHDWPPPYEGKTRELCRELMADHRGDEATLERRAYRLWEGARDWWKIMQEDRRRPVVSCEADPDWAL